MVSRSHHEIATLTPAFDEFWNFLRQVLAISIDRDHRFKTSAEQHGKGQPKRGTLPEILPLRNDLGARSGSHDGRVVPRSVVDDQDIRAQSQRPLDHIGHG